MMNLMTYHCPNCSHHWNLVSYNPKELGHCPKCPEGFIEPKEYTDPKKAQRLFKELKEFLDKEQLSQ